MQVFYWPIHLSGFFLWCFDISLSIFYIKMYICVWSGKTNFNNKIMHLIFFPTQRNNGTWWPVPCLPGHITYALNDSSYNWHRLFRGAAYICPPTESPHHSHLLIILPTSAKSIKSVPREERQLLDAGHRFLVSSATWGSSVAYIST